MTLEVVSDAAGRMRVKVDWVRCDSRRAVAVEEAVAKQNGVRVVHAYPRTGSVVVWYSPRRADRAAVLAAIGSAGPSVAAVADQPGRPAGTPGEPGGGLGKPVAAVAIQQPTGATVGIGRGPIGAVADQRTPPQRLGGRVDQTQHLLFDVGRLALAYAPALDVRASVNWS